uniref:mannosyl-oligosaccharide glucosidase n=1 Tax=Ditylenchus dipsaci TaxID=166011 RepID=A0A915DU33_9BILA
MEGDNYKVLTLNSPVFGNSDLTLQIHDKSGEPPLVTHTSLPIQTQENYVDGTQINNIILSSLGRQENGDLILVNQDSSDLATFVAVQINVKSKKRFRFSGSNGQKCFVQHAREHRLLARVFTGQESEISNPQPKQFGPLSLLSAVPSRPFFPRGFVWDEGFHNLLIRQFDPLLSIDIISSWLDTMNIAGWIPREMILGREAQAKVPAEFLVQSDAIANPPMFFYVIQKFMNDPEFMVKHGGRLRQLYPRLKQWYIWIRSTQIGPLPGTFQWQGRNATTDLELNPKEYHLDLRCWMAMASKILRRLSENCEDMGWIAEVEEDVRLFNDLDLLDQLHWSETKQQYCDYGLHSENVRLVAVQKSPQKISYVRKVLKPPKLGLVENVNGYINLFPVLLKLLPVDSPKLAAILKNLKNKEELWTPFGLRSLSFKSPYYNARNTEHDPPYWRGAIWINMNYLALDALNYYSQQSGPVKQIATELYASLKKNIVANIAVQYNKTGFFWENYNDVTGEGQGTRPFTGWTALVVNIMADDYD